MIAALVVLALCLTSCSSGKTPDPKDSDLPHLEKIADHLYETRYTTDFEWDNPEAGTVAGFSCSGVQNGQYRGRNYDWVYADTDLCIIHAAVTEKRPHASVGVADLSFILNEDGTENYAKLPFVTVDGINDAGVCIQVNVIPYGENGKLSHTESTEDDLTGGQVCRFVLDYASSVEEALTLLKTKDIHSALGTVDEFHWMISGPASSSDKTIKTVVLEVFPDGLHITEDFVDDKPIMTNFNISNFDGTPESAGIGMGYERWQILNENFDQANSVMGTFDLMEKVYYSKYYDTYADSFWYSEYNGFDLTKYFDAETLKSLLTEETYNYYMENYGGVYYNAALWDGEKALKGDISKAGIIAPLVEWEVNSYKAQDMESGSLWITVHTSVYDLENLSLDIQVRESQDHLHFTIE